jgi:hypothetical protein
MFFNDHSIIYIIFYLYCQHHIMRYYMVSSRTCHINLIKDKYQLLGYYIILLLLLLLHQSYKQTHFFHLGYKNAPLGTINLPANNIRGNVNEVALYQMKFKLMKRKIIYYPLNDNRSQIP